MKCGKCGGKGYTETFYHYADALRPMISQCCDISAYSKRVKQLFSDPVPETRGAPPAKVLQFKRSEVRRDG